MIAVVEKNWKKLISLIVIIVAPIVLYAATICHPELDRSSIYGS